MAAAAAPTTPMKYKEAPALADMVKAGKLPPVEMRLPASPRVIKPLDEVGQYGGTWHRAYRGISDFLAAGKLGEESLIEWDAPDPNTLRLVPNVAEKYEQNADATEFTFSLRKGLKWSDGSPVTSEDARFYVEDIQFGLKELWPAPSFTSLRQRVGTEFKNAAITVVDETTFKLKFAAPSPLLPILIAKNGHDNGGHTLLAPSTYLKKIHPKYAMPDALAKAAADKKVMTWQDLWGKPGNQQGPGYFYFLNPDLPVLRPWVVTKPSPADPMTMERNPYYWQVDTDGNQLPYLDKVEHAFFDNTEVFNLKIASGQIDLQMRSTSVGNYTFYKENEKKGNYTVKRWRAATTDAYRPNVTTSDKVLGKLFDTADFRQAMNIAINRQEINDLVWNGLGKARQGSPITGSPEYDAAFEKMWAEYDPKKANDLLDKLGLTKGGDGFRKRPDGQPLEITVEHTDIAASSADDAHQRVKKYWEAVGIKTNMKYVERALYEEHCRNGDIQVGTWGLDRSSVVKADPQWYIGTIDQGPEFKLWANWYLQNSYKKEEPPMDHPYREMIRIWEATQVEPDEAKRNATFQQLIALHAKAPYWIGIVGEKVSPVIVANNFRNFREGFIGDDILRDYGLINPQQFYIKK